MLAESLCTAAPCIRNHQVLRVLRKKIMPLVCLCTRGNSKHVSMSRRA